MTCPSAPPGQSLAAGDAAIGVEASVGEQLRLELALSPEQLDVLAHRVASLLRERLPAAPSAWLDAAGAAEHLACSRDRIHDLVSLGKLRPGRDGRRLLFRREDLDAYLQATR